MEHWIGLADNDIRGLLANSEQIDSCGTNRNDRLFLEHAKTYHREPSELGGLMQWNSKAAILKVAKALGFDALPQTYQGELRFSFRPARAASAISVSSR